MIITTVVAPIGAHAVHISTAAWRQHPLGTLARDAIDLYASLIVWGTIGLVIATLTRSSAIAIASGVAYALILEPIIIAAAKNVGDWLPGHTLTALAAGGNNTVAYGTAIALAAAYTLAGLTTALVTLRRRDITD